MFHIFLLLTDLSHLFLIQFSYIWSIFQNILQYFYFNGLLSSKCILRHLVGKVIFLNEHTQGTEVNELKPKNTLFRPFNSYLQRAVIHEYTLIVVFIYWPNSNNLHLICTFDNCSVIKCLTNLCISISCVKRPWNVDL